MSRVILAFMGCVLGLAVASAAPCQDLVGTVRNADGMGVAGVKIIARGADGKITGVASSDASGNYRIGNLDPGPYFITLDPAGSGVRGQTVASYLSASGLTVNWSVAPDLSPIAEANPGTRLVSAAPDNGAGPITVSSDSTPECKKKPGHPCKPKKSKKRDDD